MAISLKKVEDRYNDLVIAIIKHIKNAIKTLTSEKNIAKASYQSDVQEVHNNQKEEIAIRRKEMVTLAKSRKFRIPNEDLKEFGRLYNQLHVLVKEEIEIEGEAAMTTVNHQKRIDVEIGKMQVLLDYIEKKVPESGRRKFFAFGSRKNEVIHPLDITGMYRELEKVFESVKARKIEEGVIRKHQELRAQIEQQAKAILDRIDAIMKQIGGELGGEEEPTPGPIDDGSIQRILDREIRSFLAEYALLKALNSVVRNSKFDPEQKRSRMLKILRRLKRYERNQLVRARVSKLIKNMKPLLQDPRVPQKRKDQLRKALEQLEVFEGLIARKTKERLGPAVDAIETEEDVEEAKKAVEEVTEDTQAATAAAEEVKGFRKWWNKARGGAGRAFRWGGKTRVGRIVAGAGRAMATAGRWIRHPSIPHSDKLKLITLVRKLRGLLERLSRPGVSEEETKSLSEEAERIIAELEENSEAAMLAIRSGEGSGGGGFVVKPDISKQNAKDFAKGMRKGRFRRRVASAAGWVKGRPGWAWRGTPNFIKYLFMRSKDGEDKASDPDTGPEAVEESIEETQGFWSRWKGRASAAIGARLNISGRLRRKDSVSKKDKDKLEEKEVWFKRWWSGFVGLLGRLRPGMGRKQAKETYEEMMKRLQGKGRDMENWDHELERVLRGLSDQDMAELIAETPPKELEIVEEELGLKGKSWWRKAKDSVVNRLKSIWNARWWIGRARIPQSDKLKLITLLRKWQAFQTKRKTRKAEETMLEIDAEVARLGAKYASIRNDPDRAAAMFAVPRGTRRGSKRLRGDLSGR